MSSVHGWEHFVQDRGHFSHFTLWALIQWCLHMSPAADAFYVHVVDHIACGCSQAVSPGLADLPYYVLLLQI